jgi:hypothetical protein
MGSGNGKNWEAGAKLLKLALGLYRKELRELPDAEPSEAMLMLLRLANGDAELMAWATTVSGAGADEVHRSCIAFIEREFFGSNADPYGVLGLNPWATPADIKEHYRLLIRTFHPDRALVNPASAEVYAAMINQAYTALKMQALAQPDTLSSDAPGNSFKAGRLPEVRSHFTKPAPHAHAGFATWRWVAWLTPAKVLFGIAVIAMLIVTMVFLQQHGTMVGSFDAAAESPENVKVLSYPVEAQQQVADALPNLVLPVADSLPEASMLAEPMSPVVLNQTMPHAKKVHAEPVVPSSQRVMQSVTASGASSEDGQPQQLALVAKAITPNALANGMDSHTLSDDPQVNGEDSYNAAATPPAMVHYAVAPGENIAQAPSDRELHDLIAKFMNSYQQGDASEFMRVFDERVRTGEAGGKQGLHNTYARFFSKTSSREIVLKDLDWKRSGTLVTGQADYRASTTLRAGDAEPRISFGTLRFEVTKTGAAVLIVGFYHLAAKN